MNNSAQNKNHSLMEAYYAVYDENIRNELNEEKEIKEFLEVIDFLIEDGYDLSEYTYEELYEYHITERLGGLLKGAATGIGTLLKKSGGQIYQGAKEPAKKVLTKLGKIAVPTAIAAGLDQYLTGGKVREYTGSAIQGIRQMGHSMPTPGQAADAFKAPETTKPTPSRRNLPPAHLTQGYSYGKNNIITEDPAFPSQKPKGGDWSKLTIGGITKIWDPENNSYQLPGTINKRLKSQGEKEITVPGKAPAPAPTPTPSPAPSPSPSPAPKPTPSPAPSPSRSSSSATASTADKIKGGMDVYNKQRSSGDFKGASETGKSVWALSNPKLAAAAAERERTRGTSQSDNPLMRGMPGKRPMTPSVQSPTLATDLGKGSGNQSILPGGPKTRAQVMSNSYEYDAYDLVLEYLLSQGHVETVEEANYVMLVMDAETIGTIVEEYENDLLAEEITEWVNELVEEGYDLSEYTWDDLAEYYVNEANKAEKMLGLTSRQRERARNLNQYTNKPIFYGTNANRRKKADNSDPILNKAHKGMTAKRKASHKAGRGTRGDSGESTNVVKSRYQANKDHEDGYPSITKRGQGPT